MTQLTKDQHDALALNRGEAMHVFDPFDNREYVLVPTNVFEHFAAMVRPFEELWTDPKMDDYNRYEELRPGKDAKKSNQCL